MERPGRSADRPNLKNLRAHLRHFAPHVGRHSCDFASLFRAFLAWRVYKKRLARKLGREDR
eukprot:scaffold5910_cov239-Pinguiococcus_pyrenoidosus.AAC.4